MHWLSLVVSILVFGCASEDTPSAENRDAGGEDAGGGEDAALDSSVLQTGCAAGLTPCDIRERDCQEAVGHVVACFRDSDAAVPEVRLVSEAQYEEDLATNTTSTDVLTALRIERWIRALALFGLAPADSTPEDRAGISTELTGAAYSLVTKDIAVIDRGMPLDEVDVISLLAHEIVHGQQDQERDLSAWGAQWISNEDTALAVGSVFEGEAMHYQLMMNAALRGNDPERMEWSEYYATWQAEQYDAADEDEFPYLTMRARFCYAFGGNYVANVLLDDGRSGVEALFEAPPLSSRTILFASDKGEAEAVDALYPVALPEPAIGYSPVTYSALGAWLVRAFLVRAGFDAEAALEATRDVGADVFSGQVQPEDDLISGVWRWQLIAGASGDWVDAIDFAGVQVTRDGELITLAAGPSEVLDTLATARWGSAPKPY